MTYQIQNLKTGNFANGSTDVRWQSIGHSWESIDLVAKHIRQSKIRTIEAYLNPNVYLISNIDGKIDTRPLQGVIDVELVLANKKHQQETARIATDNARKMRQMREAFADRKSQRQTIEQAFSSLISGEIRKLKRDMYFD